jgi:hypothetical protein
MRRARETRLRLELNLGVIERLLRRHDTSDGYSFSGKTKGWMVLEFILLGFIPRSFSKGFSLHRSGPLHTVDLYLFGWAMFIAFFAVIEVVADQRAGGFEGHR